MNRLLLILLMSSISFVSYAQVLDIDWALLAKVKWGEKYFEEYDETVYYPDFSEEVSALNNKAIRIKGYIIPVDVTSGYYVLSANPYTSCFFCGNAGPETIMELQLVSDDNSFTTDEVVTFIGVLKLNWDDLEHCNYILQNAKSE